MGTKGTWSRVKDWKAYGRTMDRIQRAARRRRLVRALVKLRRD